VVLGARAATLAQPFAPRWRFLQTFTAVIAAIDAHSIIHSNVGHPHAKATRCALQNAPVVFSVRRSPDGGSEVPPRNARDCAQWRRLLQAFNSREIAKDAVYSYVFSACFSDICENERSLILYE
jgi:hypothetical protein